MVIESTAVSKLLQSNVSRRQNGHFPYRQELRAPSLPIGPLTGFYMNPIKVEAAFIVMVVLQRTTRWTHFHTRSTFLHRTGVLSSQHCPLLLESLLMCLAAWLQSEAGALKEESLIIFNHRTAYNEQHVELRVHWENVAPCLCVWC